jgi:hypothetical protein
MDPIGQCASRADAKSEAASLYFALAVDLLTDLFSTYFFFASTFRCKLLCSVANKMLSHGHSYPSLVESSGLLDREDQCGLGNVCRRDNHDLRHCPGKLLGGLRQGRPDPDYVAGAVGFY